MCDSRAKLGVALSVCNPCVHQHAERLAKQLRLPIWDAPSKSNADITLVATSDRLELRENSSVQEKGICVDFSFLISSARQVVTKNQLIGRAIGKKTKTVLDATAGLGRDAALLAAMGFHVLSVDRSPILVALLQDGLRRALLDTRLQKIIGDRLTFQHADARDMLQKGDSHPDAVYIDPMFPPKRKSSALAKKSVRMIRKIVGNDDDAAELVNVARRHARRVVIKYPSYSQPLADNPTHTCAGKLVRYDVYLNS